MTLYNKETELYQLFEDFNKIFSNKWDELDPNTITVREDIEFIDECS